MSKLWTETPQDAKEMSKKGHSWLQHNIHAPLREKESITAYQTTNTHKLAVMKLIFIPEAEHSPVVASSAPSAPGWLSTAGSGSPVCSADQKLPLQRWTPPDHYRPCWLSQLSPCEPKHHFGEPEEMKAARNGKMLGGLFNFSSFANPIVT